MREALPNEEEIAEIADSPRLQWSLQSRLARKKAEDKIRRNYFWQLALAFGCLLIVGGLSVSTWLNVFNPAETVAALPAPEIQPTTSAIATPNIAEKSEIKPIQTSVRSERKTAPTKFVAVKIKQKFVVPKQSARSVEKPFVAVKNTPRSLPENEMAKNETAEVKTDFIPLTYSSTTESGQIVRVKVPRAMMISLGATTSDGDSAELVKAEVLIDDEGTARAIRFIR